MLFKKLRTEREGKPFQSRIILLIDDFEDIQLTMIIQSIQHQNNMFEYFQPYTQFQNISDHIRLILHILRF